MVVVYLTVVLVEISRCYAQALVLGKYGDVCVSTMNLPRLVFGEILGVVSNFKFALLEHYRTRIARLDQFALTMTEQHACFIHL